MGSVSAKKKGTHVLTHGKPFVARCPELGVQPTVSDLNFQTEKARLLISQFSRQLLLAKFLYEGSFPIILRGRRLWQTLVVGCYIVGRVLGR